MHNSPLTKDQILQDIESIYQRALADGKRSVALRAREIQGKIMGPFKPQRLPDAVRIADMTQDQWGEFIGRLEENEPELWINSPKIYLKSSSSVIARPKAVATSGS